jgi:hypothetical protein
MKKYTIESFYEKFKSDNILRKDVTEYFLNLYFSKEKITFEQKGLVLFSTYSFNYVVNLKKRDDLMSRFMFKNLGILTEVTRDDKIKIINLLFLPEILRVKILSLIYSYEISLEEDVKLEDIKHKESDPNIYKLKNGLERFVLWIKSKDDLKYSINEFEINRIQNMKQIHFKDNILVPLINEKDIIDASSESIFKIAQINYK